MIKDSLIPSSSFFTKTLVHSSILLAEPLVRAPITPDPLSRFSPTAEVTVAAASEVSFVSVVMTEPNPYSGISPWLMYED